MISGSQSFPLPPGLLCILLYVSQKMNSHERRALTRKKLYETREAVGPHNRPKQDSNKPNIMTVPNPPPPPPKNPDPNGSKDNTPRWAKFTQIGALLVAIGLLFATLIQSCATQKAAETADGTLREMKTTSQPWVGLENNLISIDGPPSWGDTSLPRNHNVRRSAGNTTT